MKIQLQRGVEPWQGHAHAEVVGQYHYHDMPLIGVLDQDGQKYLFRCEVGEVEPVNYWSYTRLTSADRKAIERTDGEAFDEVVDRLARNAEAVAIAIEGFGIVVWNHIDEASEFQEMVDMLARQFKDQLGRLVETAESEAVTFADDRELVAG